MRRCARRAWSVGGDWRRAARNAICHAGLTDPPIYDRRHRARASVAWELRGDGGAAVREHERAVLDAGGVVLRYGRFYGPCTYHPDDVAEPPAVHVEEAARRTAEALDAPGGVIRVVDVTG